ncbi:type III-B CRISPR module RAMP protein Cmr1 [Moorella sp. Hama-1]|uniref:type III-B CRISPR module RAMP protein Cmr1 n=1 Tax=Moorella sp. Hama-1 TaxID=2138101 RepID=UPI000D659657|nr:type III-B CRISPR module RAMP protein Cmr1 [Moorella sp. Hama-1]BCV20503.1 hypothetical protein hamaS1_05720 [Moorella sp. Hama-1]
MPDAVLTFEVLTPMFLAGADIRQPELRGPAVKGALRFWWRAIHGFDPQLQKNEGAIFGFTGEGSRKSSLILKIEGEDAAPYITREPFPRHNYLLYPVKGRDLNILEYIAYGTYTYDKITKKNVFDRSYIKPGYSFRLVIQMRNNDCLQEVIMALQYFCWFVALGAKSRNGFGSLKVKAIEGHLSTEVRQSLTSLPGKNSLVPFNNCKELPEFSALSGGARLFKTRQDYGNWDACLGELGHAYRKSRLSLEPSHSYHKRRYIGAPLTVNKMPKSRLDRHAKPYFLRVHERQGRYTGYLLYLPSHYCTGLVGKKSDIDPAREDAAFTRACQEMNQALGQNLEVVY